MILLQDFSYGYHNKILKNNTCLGKTERMKTVRVLMESVLSLKPAWYVHPTDHSSVFAFHCPVPLAYTPRCACRHTRHNVEQKGS